MKETEIEALIDKARLAIENGKCQEVIAWLLPLAESGNVDAQFLLGDMFFADCDYPFPDTVARDWLLKARAQGHADACYHLAWFPDAQGVSSINDSESMNLLIEAGERGSVEAQRDLGAHFATGDWVGGKDEKKAVEWYIKAAHQGHAESQYDLGLMILLGEGSPRDTAKGIDWLIIAAEQGNHSAARLLADTYKQGLFGVSIDPEEARRWEGVLRLCGSA